MYADADLDGDLHCVDFVWRKVAAVPMLASMEQKCRSTPPLIRAEDYSPAEIKDLVEAVRRATAIDRRVVLSALLGGPVRDSSRLSVARALRDLQQPAAEVR